MIRIRLYEHPFAGPVAPKIFEVESLARWLLDYYGPTPDVRLQIYRGQPSGETEITDDFRALLSNDANEYVVLQTPGAPAVPFLINMAIALAVSVVMSLLFPPPSMPANVNRTQQSPNNALAQRENQVRLMQRVEDIYGSVRSVPSLMMQTYTKYHNHLEYEYGYYCVSRGYCFLVDIKDGDTPLEETTGASAAVYHPFSSPNYGPPVQTIGDPIIDYIVNVRRAIEVDGITLKAENQINLLPGEEYTFQRVSGRNRITQTNKTPNFNAVASVGDTIQVAGGSAEASTQASAAHPVTVSAGDSSLVAPTGNLWAHIQAGGTVVISGMANAANNGTYTVATRTSTKITLSGASLVDEVTESARFTVENDYSGTYTVHTVGDGWVALTTTNWPTTAYTGTADITFPEKSHLTDWVTLSERDRTEVWVNVVAPQGMYKDDGGSRSTAEVQFGIQIERLDANTLAPTGQVETLYGSISGSVSDERAVTIEHVTAWVGPARVRMWRETSYDYWFNGVVIDEIKWDDLYAVTPVGAQHFGNKTTIHTVTRATARATAARTRQLNCIAGRMLPTYDGAGGWSAVLNEQGQLVSGTLNSTDRMIDIIAAVTTDARIGGRPITDLDINQIWSVQQELDAWSDRVGKFNYTFDSDTLSFEETVAIIANAAFCVPYRQNGKIRLALDKPQPAPAALFTHRNKKPNAESITRKFAADSEYDGVEFVYHDDISRQPETIILPGDGSWTKLKKFEIPGITDFTQAWYRANREYYKLRGQRVNIETEVTTDARMLLPFTRVEIVDNTRFKAFDGEVIGQDGLELTLSRDVEFNPGESHSIILMRRDGSLQSISATAGSAANKVVLAAAPAEAIVTEESPDGIRTIFSFAADSFRGAQAWSVQEIGGTDGQYLTIKAVNYDPSFYQMDAQPVPVREQVIT